MKFKGRFSIKHALERSIKRKENALNADRSEVGEARNSAYVVPTEIKSHLDEFETLNPAFYKRYKIFLNSSGEKRDDYLAALREDFPEESKVLDAALNIIERQIEVRDERVRLHEKFIPKTIRMINRRRVLLKALEKIRQKFSKKS